MMNEDLQTTHMKKGFHDKEMNRKPNWNYFENNYSSYLSNIKFGKIS